MVDFTGLVPSLSDVLTEAAPLAAIFGGVVLLAGAIGLGKMITRFVVTTTLQAIGSRGR